MQQNQEKAISLRDLYSMVIDSAVSGYLYINYLKYGIPYSPNPKHRLYINNYKASGYIKVRLDKKHHWLISKYEYDYYT